MNGSPVASSVPPGALPAAAAPPSGADAQSPLGLSARAWRQVLRRVWVMAGFHELGLLSAGVAFYCFLAITPLIAATVMIYGLVGDPATVREQAIALVEIMPPEAATVIEGQLLQILATSTGVTGLALIVALFFAVYGGMRAASGLVSALNVINEEHETRGVVALTLRAALLTIAALALALSGIGSGVVLAWLQNQTSVYLGAGLEALFVALAWIVALVAGSSAFALIMRYGPDRRAARWRWLAPGAMLATALWLAVSLGFSVYVAYISNYSATYGSLSAVVVFLMWLYLSAYAALLGALVNAEIERQTFCDTTVGPPRPAGERGAVLADLLDDAVPRLSDLQTRKARHAHAARRAACAPDTAADST